MIVYILPSNNYPMSRFWKTYKHWIPQKWVVNSFRGPSPLSRRTLRGRLGFPPRAVLSAVLFQAEKEGPLVRVSPAEAGSNSLRPRLYRLVPKESD